MDPHTDGLRKALRQSCSQLVLSQRTRAGTERSASLPTSREGARGAGSINGMIYMRGQREDFDGWRQLGCTGWSYWDVLPYFKKSEHQQRGANEYHATDGPLWVSDLPSKHELADAFISAGRRTGIAPEQ